MFTSDHGYMIGQQRPARQRNAITSSEREAPPPRPDAAEMFEESIRIPLIVRCGRDETGPEIPQPVSNLDNLRHGVVDARGKAPATGSRKGWTCRRCSVENVFTPTPRFTGKYDLQNDALDSCG